MRRILDREGDAQTSGLRHALHICRGTSRPMARRHRSSASTSGTYWWPAHVRGAAEEGTVEKDYRIRLDDGPAESSRRASAATTWRRRASRDPADAYEHTGRDPDHGGRGLASAQRHPEPPRLGGRDAGHLAAPPEAGRAAVRPRLGGRGEVTWVAEVKSITHPENEERQLRTALGQVLRYRQLLAKWRADGEGDDRDRARADGFELERTAPRTGRRSCLAGEDGHPDDGPLSRLLPGRCQEGVLGPARGRRQRRGKPRFQSLSLSRRTDSNRRPPVYKTTRRRPTRPSSAFSSRSPSCSVG